MVAEYPLLHSPPEEMWVRDVGGWGRGQKVCVPKIGLQITAPSIDFLSEENFSVVGGCVGDEGCQTSDVRRTMLMRQNSGQSPGKVHGAETYDFHTLLHPPTHTEDQGVASPATSEGNAWHLTSAVYLYQCTPRAAPCLFFGVTDVEGGLSPGLRTSLIGGGAERRARGPGLRLVPYVRVGERPQSLA